MGKWWFNGNLWDLPSGKQTYLWKDPPFLMGILTMSQAMFNSYVKLPEGNYQHAGFVLFMINRH